MVLIMSQKPHIPAFALGLSYTSEREKKIHFFKSSIVSVNAGGWIHLLFLESS